LLTFSFSSTSPNVVSRQEFVGTVVSGWEFHP
jgi:hypothetical protein